MTIKTQNTPYSYVTTITNDEGDTLTFSVDSKYKFFNLTSSKSKYSTVAVKYEELVHKWASCDKEFSYYSKDLEETTTFTCKGVYWIVKQCWGEDTQVETAISNTDIYQLFSKWESEIRINKHMGEINKPFWNKKLYNKVVELYNLPRKLIKW